MKKKNNELEYFELAEVDFIQYKKYAKKRLIHCTMFYCIFFPIFIIIAKEIIDKSYSLIWILITFILYTLLVFCPYIIYFAGKPSGIRYGTISKKVLIRYGRYGGYKYNIYFKDIHKSLIEKNIVLNREHPVVNVHDKVKVIKSKFGFLYIFVYD